MAGGGPVRRESTRDARYEILRIAAMLMIVLCHAVAYLPWGLEEYPGWKGDAAIGVDQFGGQFGVSTFFMLSGFFLVDHPFSFKRPVKVLAQTFCYSAVCTAVMGLVYPHIGFLRQPNMPWHGVDLVFYLYIGLAPVINNAYWFITAYVLMTLFSPLVNLALARLTRSQALWFMCLAGFLSVMPFISFSGFAYNGLFWTTLVYALLCYAIGGWIRLHGRSLRRSPGMLHVLIYGVLAYAGLTAFIHVARGQSAVARFFAWKPRSIYGTLPLLAVILSAMILLALSRGPKHRSTLPTMSGKVVNAVAASTFGVYLIHQNMLVGSDVWRIAGRIAPAPSPHGIVQAAFVLVAVVLAVFALLSACSWIFDNLVVRPLQNLAARALNGSRAERFAAELSRSWMEGARDGSETNGAR